MTGSNRRPSACKADALPAELILHLMVTRTGFEPVYACVKGMCVKPLHQRALMVGLGGLEPPTSRLSGVRSNQLSYESEMVSP